MNPFSLFRRKQAEPETVAITVAGQHLDARLRPDEELKELENALVTVLEGTGLGDFDLVEAARNSVIVHLSGPDGERLFHGIRSTLEGMPLCQGAHVLIQHGAKHRETTIEGRWVEENPAVTN